MGPTEYTEVYFCAFIVTSSLIGDSIIKGLLSTLLGILVSLIGFDPITGEERYTFGINYFLEGVALVPVLLGLFILSKIFIQVTDRNGLKGGRTIVLKSDDPDDNRLTWPEYKRILPVIYRSTSIGTLIGTLPGIGAAVAG